MLSPPSRRRGLKFSFLRYLNPAESVASLAEAWIEIPDEWNYIVNDVSPPSRRRGLKLNLSHYMRRTQVVASLAEAWIEIVPGRCWIQSHNCRLPRGGVD